MAVDAIKKPIVPDVSFWSNLGRINFVSGQMSCVIYIPNGYRGTMFLNSSETTLNGIYRVHALSGGNSLGSAFYAASAITITNGSNRITLTSSIADGVNIAFLTQTGSTRPYFISGNQA